MAKDEIDTRLRESLDDALIKVDKVVMHKYISTIDKRPVYIPSYDVAFSEPEKRPDNIPLCIVGTNIMLSKLKRVVYDKDENILDKLTTAYNATALYEGATLVLLLKSDGSQIEVYYGTVCKKTDDSFVPQKQIDALKSNVEANFPGSELELVVTMEDRMRIVQSVFENNVCISAVSGIAALKDEDGNENKTYVQGLEKLTDSLKGKKCTVMVIADPVNDNVRESIRSGYEEIYSALKPFEKSEYSVNSNNGKTVTDSVIKGVTDTTNESVAKTKTHTTTKGTNSSHTVGGSVGVNTSVTATAGVSVAPFGVGPNASASATVGTSVSADYHYMHGKHEDESDSEGETNTSGTSKSLSEQNSIANALSSTKGEGLQITYENRSVKSILDRIDLQLERIEECEDFGMYDCGVYFLSDDYTTCLSVASTYKSLIQGEHSSVESAHISLWDKDEAKALIPYLSTFNHPIFDIADKEDEKSSASVSTLVSGKELAIYMGLPKKSISGIPVIECASFGRNVLYSEDKKDSKKIDFGCIHHMRDDELTRVLLDKNSLTSHTFVTGSTGAGKSNAIYQLLRNTCMMLEDELQKTHFMVIEPAKGEYKDVFGGYDNVEVYGTNPFKNKLLKINPFSFPEEIHVLEHIDRLIEIFNVCWPMYAAMPAVLKEAIERAYEAAGWDLNRSVCRYSHNSKKMFPNFLDVLNQVNKVITESKYSADSKGDYVGALSMRISSLTNGINGQILTNDERTYEELFDKNVIIDLSRVGSTETKALLMGLLIIKLQEYRMSSATGTNKKLSHITVLEEAHNILKKTSPEQGAETANLTGKSVEMLANAIAEMRTYGEGFVIADQSPGLMDMSVIRNTNTKIILRLPDATDRELVGKSANLNDEQIVELAKLQTGVCAVYQNNWIEPVLCHVDEWDKKWSKKCKVEKNDIPNTIEIKSDIVKLVLQPIPSIQKEAKDRIMSSIDQIMLSSELKLNLLKLTRETDLEKARNLRKSIIYEIFAPDAILERNICYRNEIKEWMNAMENELIPQLENFDEDEVDKILSLLAMEKNRIEGKREYDELINNLLIFMDTERRRF
ncbi:ATP-binding protein [Lachnospira multipara]|uniref:ATP-binding protein n=1 Tax=Lachnospira multipara TaxID=28051 RepID=UPI00068676AF|nr:ATP-binding protein [Lachnospira multipara]